MIHWFLEYNQINYMTEYIFGLGYSGIERQLSSSSTGVPPASWAIVEKQDAYPWQPFKVFSGLRMK